MRFKAKLDLDQNSLVIPLNKMRFRTKAQNLAFQNLLKNGRFTDAVQYVETFNGNQMFYSADFKKVKLDGDDKLKSKKPNQFKALFDAMLRTDVSHRPYTDSQDFFGIEIECFIPYGPKTINGDVYNFGNGRESICSDCDGSGTVLSIDEVYNDETEQYNEVEDHVECECCGGSGEVEDSGDVGFCHRVLKNLFHDQRIKYCSIKGDGSIQPASGHFPVEITVLSRFSTTDNLKQLCGLLNRLGAKVNKSCGMHVHLDARHLKGGRSVRNVGTKFQNALPLLLKLVPESRRSNSYCRPSVSGLRGERYYAVNLTSWNKYKTIEVRLHSSTTNFDKILAWSVLCSRIFHATKLNKTCTELNDLTDFVYLEEPYVEYFTQREIMFNPSLWSVESVNVPTVSKSTDLIPATDSDVA